MRAGIKKMRGVERGPPAGGVGGGGALLAKQKL